jgi:hypothetical protein
MAGCERYCRADACELAPIRAPAGVSGDRVSGACRNARLARHREGLAVARRNPVAAEHVGGAARDGSLLEAASNDLEPLRRARVQPDVLVKVLRAVEVGAREFGATW